jgi:magnesium-transporting ATPase (P-type)
VLREETPGVLQELEKSKVTSTMITGDSVLTGICIARQAGMIKPNRTLILGTRLLESEVEWVGFDTNSDVAKPSSTALDMQRNDVDVALTGDAWSILLNNDPKYASFIESLVDASQMIKSQLLLLLSQMVTIL